MQVQDQRRTVEATADHGGSASAGRTRGWAVAAVIAATALVVVTIVALQRGPDTLRTDGSSAAGPVHGPSHVEARPTALRAATGWVDGLAAGLILPTEVDSRLAVRDPEAAEVVVAAWSDLSSLSEPARIERAVSWIDGLTAGRILPTEVDPRLAARDPEMADVVMAAWSALRSLGAR